MYVEKITADEFIRQCQAAFAHLPQDGLPRYLFEWVLILERHMNTRQIAAKDQSTEHPMALFYRAWGLAKQEGYDKEAWKTAQSALESASPPVGKAPSAE